jgi:chaperonin cofactor prefoldin
MDGDDSSRISKLEWRLNDIEGQLATLSDAQRRVEETILKLSSAVETLCAAGEAHGSGND